jgi:omega-6 fatty acid desaturase (delta-12 desaturase)
MTVDEYLASPRLTRLAYRIVRNPVLMFGFGPAIMFLVVERFTMQGAKKDDRRSVILTDLAMLAIILVASATIGLGTYVLIQAPIIVIGGAAGIWLFYVQHQFERTYWAPHDDWDPVKASLLGSSYYRLPKVLQWFTGNIGLHHIHHIRPRIANHTLQRAYDEVPELREVETITFRKSLRSLWLNLWDERQQKMVSFRAIRKFPRRAMQHA